MSKAYRFDDVDNEGALVYFGEPEKFMGYPRQLLIHMGEAFPKIDLEKPDYTIDDYSINIGHSDAIMQLTGSVTLFEVEAKAYRLGKPEGYPDEDDLFLVIGEYEGQPFFCFNGEDTLVLEARSGHYSDVCVVPDLAEFFAAGAALYA